MKTASLLFLFIPALCFSQTESKAPVKSSTTDCPTWKNKAQVSKANYFESLRHTKTAKDPQQLASVSKKEVPVKKVNEPKEQKAYVPSFSASEDKVLSEKKEIPEKAPEKNIAEKPAIKKEKTESVATNAKPKAEKKTQKRKNADYSSGKVRTSKKNAQKCPAF